MSKPAHYTDDDTLELIIRRHRQGRVLETVYNIYRVPFVSFFHQYFAINLPQAEELLGQSLQLLFQEIWSRSLKAPKESTLFKILLLMGYVLHQEKGEDRPEAHLDRSLKRLRRLYLEADILLTLVREKDDVAHEFIHLGFKEPTFTLLRHKYGFRYDELNFDPEEYYQKSTQTLKEKIRQGPPKGPAVPMEATLFTYFFRIAQWQFRNYLKKGRKKSNIGERESWESLKPPEQQERQYIDYLLQKWPVLQKYTFNNEKELIRAFGKELGEANLLLLQQLAEGKSYKEIAKLMDKTEGAVRKMAFDCRRKVREKLGVGGSKS